jgi:hypothetical protein
MQNGRTQGRRLTRLDPLPHSHLEVPDVSPVPGDGTWRDELVASRDLRRGILKNAGRLPMGLIAKLQ